MLTLTAPTTTPADWANDSDLRDRACALYQEVYSLARDVEASQAEAKAAKPSYDAWGWQQCLEYAWGCVGKQHNSEPLGWITHGMLFGYSQLD